MASGEMSDEAFRAFLAEALGACVARKLDRYRETARMALEPWIVEEALARLGETVVRATRTPRKVRWPDWWSAR